jgi:NAD-dependent SIR2 family protein deacetylase
MSELMVKWRCERCGSAYKFEDDEVPIAWFKCMRSMSPNDMAVRTQICGGEVKPDSTAQRDCKPSGGA